MKLNQIRVLLVEDDYNVRKTLHIMLSEMGIKHIDEAINGMDALPMMEGALCKYHLIICDWNMPKKTGAELLREIRMTHPKVPFLMITARADQQSIMTAKDAGVTSYIRKPINFDHLRQHILSIFQPKPTSASHLLGKL